MSMKEGKIRDFFAETRRLFSPEARIKRRKIMEASSAAHELDRQERFRLLQEKGLMPLSSKFRGVFVPEKEETSDIPSKFFTLKRNEEGDLLFEEHNIRFPIEDPAQLLASLKGFDALYRAQEGSYLYARDNPTLFIQFIGSFVGGKESQPKS